MTAEPTYRLATEGDFGAEHAIFCRAEGDVRRAHAYEWIDPPVDVFSRFLGHLRTTDPGRCFVATIDERIAGFTAAIVRDDTWFFSALFIDPDFQGQGIGRHLFELAVADAPTRRMTITDSIQPISNALYARHGLIPATPLLLFGGAPIVPGETELQAVTPSDEMLVGLDRAAYGFDRSADHPYWGARRKLTVWARHDEPVGYAYVAGDGTIGPLAGRDPESAAAVMRAELARLSSAAVEMPGTARSLVSTALEAGLRIQPPPGLLLTSEGVAPPTSIAISSYGLP